MNDMAGAVDDASVGFPVIESVGKLHLDAHILHRRGDERPGSSSQSSSDRRVAVLVEVVEYRELDGGDEGVSNHGSRDSSVESSHSFGLHDHVESVVRGAIELGVRLHLHLDRVEGMSDQGSGDARHGSGELVFGTLAQLPSRERGRGGARTDLYLRRGCRDLRHVEV